MFETYTDMPAMFAYSGAIKANLNAFLTWHTVRSIARQAGWQAHLLSREAESERKHNSKRKTKIIDQRWSAAGGQATGFIFQTIFFMTVVATAAKNINYQF